jgi:hypothetical protein
VASVLGSLGLILACAACGSTVQRRGALGRAADQSLGTSSADSSSDAGAGGAGTNAAGDTAGAGAGATGQGGSTAAARAKARAQGAAGGGGGTPADHGVQATQITIGVSYVENAGAANAAIGGKGITTGNEKQDAQIVIDDVNRHGGVLGRKVVPLFYVRDAQSTAPVATQAQAECVFYTQDHKVFAVLQGNGPIDWAMKPCLNGAGVPAITSHISSLDDDTPNGGANVDVAGMGVTRMGQAMVAAIQSNQWLSPWNAATGAPGATSAKVGVVGYDLPAVRHAIDRVVVPGLKALGHAPDPADVILIPVPASQSDTAASASALQSANLKLRSDGVDHVVLFDQGGAMTLLFSNEAYSQRYFPRYAGSSSNGFQALLSGGSIQAQTLVGVVGAGWEPVIDLPFSDKGPFVSADRTRCLQLLNAGGQKFSDANAEAVALSYCDKLYFLQRAVDVAGTPTLAAYVAAVDGLGSFPTSRGIEARFAAGRHDGASAFYGFGFDSGCKCIAYQGARQTVP